MELCVFVVDDEAGIRRALQRVFRLAGLETRCYASAQEFLEAYQPDMGGCLVLDMSMPVMNGLELQRELVARGIDLPTVFLTGRGDIASAVEAMKQGAVDYLQKPFDPEILTGRIQRALELHARARAKRVYSDEVNARYRSLTPREREVMMLVVKGLTSKEIAELLGASKKTIDIHRGRVMQKMDVDSLAELVQSHALLDRHD